MDKQRKIPLTMEQLNPAPSSTIVAVKAEEHHEYFGIVRILKRKREMDARKREGEEAYIQYLEEEVIQLSNEYWRVKEKMVSKMTKLVADKTNMFKQLRALQNRPEYEGSRNNESKSEPISADGEHGL